MNNKNKNLVGLVLAGALALNGCTEEEMRTQYKPNPIVYVTTAQRVEINPIYESSGNVSKWRISGVCVKKIELKGSKYGIVQEKTYTEKDPEFGLFKDLVRIEQEK